MDDSLKCEEQGNTIFVDSDCPGHAERLGKLAVEGMQEQCAAYRTRIAALEAQLAAARNEALGWNRLYQNVVARNPPVRPALTRRERQDAAVGRAIGEGVSMARMFG